MFPRFSSLVETVFYVRFAEETENSIVGSRELLSPSIVKRLPRKYKDQYFHSNTEFDDTFLVDAYFRYVFHATPNRVLPVDVNRIIAEYSKSYFASTPIGMYHCQSPCLYR